MEELSLIARHEPGIAQIENFAELKAILETEIAGYKGLVFSEESLKLAKEHKKIPKPLTIFILFVIIYYVNLWLTISKSQKRRK